MTESSDGSTLPVEAIYIATHKHDMRLTRICVASIRYWYPGIPIFLIKDRIGGDFSTEEIEREWNVGVFQTDVDKFGWGFAKLEPIFKEGGERALIIDADIAFVGKVLDVLSRQSESMLVHHEDQPPEPSGRFKELYFSLDLLRKYDPAFHFPQFSFNSGQFVVKTGILSRSDFDGLIKWDAPRSVARPEIFNKSDQGVLNYVAMKKQAEGEISIARLPFMVWNPDEMRGFEISRINQESPYPQLIHWAGLRRPSMMDMPRADILAMFEDLYYSRIRWGPLRRRARLVAERAANLKSKAIARVTRQYPRLYLT